MRLVAHPVHGITMVPFTQVTNTRSLTRRAEAWTANGRAPPTLSGKVTEIDHAIPFRVHDGRAPGELPVRDLDFDLKRLERAQDDGAQGTRAQMVDIPVRTRLQEAARGCRRRSRRRGRDDRHRGSAERRRRVCSRCGRSGEVVRWIGLQRGGLEHGEKNRWCLPDAMAVVVAVHTVLEPVYYVSTDAQPYSPVWEILDPLMVVAVALGTVLAWRRKAAADRDAGGPVTREYLAANVLFFGFLFVAVVLLRNWLDQISPAFTAVGLDAVNVMWVVVDATLLLLYGAAGVGLLRHGSPEP